MLPPIRLKLCTDKFKHMFAFVDIIYGIACFLVKFSILLLYCRLFSVYQSSRRLIVGGHVFIAFNMIGAVGNSIARVSVCTDIAKAMVTPFCSGENVSIVLIVVAALNATADCYILAIPLQRITKMKISMPKKVGLLVIFLGGLM